MYLSFTNKTVDTHTHRHIQTYSLLTQTSTHIFLILFFLIFPHKSLLKAQITDLLRRIKDNNQARFIRFLTSICYGRSSPGDHNKRVIRRNQSLVSEILLKHFTKIIMPIRLLPKTSLPRGKKLHSRYHVWPKVFADKVR